jgi:N-acetylglucosamine kinase-like BadF-type ATPase
MSDAVRRYVLAVDGGQTHSLAIVADEEGHVLGAGKGGPANHFVEPGGPERFSQSMRDCIHDALRSAGLLNAPLAAAYYCLTGVHDQMKPLVQQIAPAGQVQLAGDKDASLVGATFDCPAVLVLAGTGSIACGIDAHGREVALGGWGYLMGDEGSAYWIARLALSAATSATDGRSMATLLTSRIPQYFGVRTLRDVHALLYAQKVDRVVLAGLAAVVGAAAMEGDRVAQALLSNAGQELGEMAVAVIRRLSLMDVPVTVTTAGGVFRAGGLVLNPMLAALNAACPFAHYAPPRFPPIIGALFLALRIIGVASTEAIVANAIATQAMWKRYK